eukprot:Polyplicarium_translucidae@DN3405_c0_g1_i1.p2
MHKRTVAEAARMALLALHTHKSWNSFHPGLLHPVVHTHQSWILSTGSNAPVKDFFSQVFRCTLPCCKGVFQITGDSTESHEAMQLAASGLAYSFRRVRPGVFLENLVPLIVPTVISTLGDRHRIEALHDHEQQVQCR